MQQDYTRTGSPMKDERGYLSDDQCNAMLKACEGRDKLLLLMLLKTGRRISEVVRNNDTGIRYMDIDLEEGQIYFRILKHGKRNKKTKEYIPDKDRIAVQIDDELRDKLKYYIGLYCPHPEGYLFDFSRQRGFQIVQEIALRAAKEHPNLFTVGLTKTHKDGRFGNVVRVQLGDGFIKAHTTRHTFAMHAANALDSPAALVDLSQNFLHHGNLGTTMHYLRHGKKEKSRQKELINKIWKK